MKSKKKRILICNDDSLYAPGIMHLAEVAQEFGEIFIVAPEHPQSGMGHAITIGEPIRLYEEKLLNGMKGWASTGTPADCIKLATGVLMKEHPDLILSGINHGQNASISVVYSGTMSAAMEGAIEGIPAIGFSLCDYSHDADFDAARHVVRTLLRNAFDDILPRRYLMNVNIPAIPLNQIKGMRITRQAKGRWVEEFERRLDPHGKDYYWLTGKFEMEDKGDDTDIWALEHNYVSITPVQFDLTAHHHLSSLQAWNPAFLHT